MLQTEEHDYDEIFFVEVAYMETIKSFIFVATSEKQGKTKKDQNIFPWYKLIKKSICIKNA